MTKLESFGQAMREYRYSHSGAEFYKALYGEYPDWYILSRMTPFQKFLARLRVLATAAPTYLVAAALLIPFIVEQITPLLPGDVAATIANYASYVVAWLGAIVAIIRRVTPVPSASRGLLVPAGRTITVLAEDPPPAVAEALVVEVPEHRLES